MENLAELEEGEEITQEDAWTVASAFFAENSLAQHQQDSFDDFVQSALQRVVDGAPEIEVREKQQGGEQQASPDGCKYLEKENEIVKQSKDRLEIERSKEKRRYDIHEDKRIRSLKPAFRNDRYKK